MIRIHHQISLTAFHNNRNFRWAFKSKNFIVLLMVMMMMCLYFSTTHNKLNKLRLFSGRLCWISRALFKKQFINISSTTTKNYKMRHATQVACCILSNHTYTNVFLFFHFRIVERKTSSDFTYLNCYLRMYR